MISELPVRDPEAPLSRSAPALRADQLVKTYKGGVTALQGLSFQVEQGEVFALLGPNGAGKSTAVKILTTLSRPDSGRATVAGEDVVRHPNRVRRVIGVVAQKSAIDREATGAENVMLQGQLYGLGGRELRQRVSALLERFDLAGSAGRIAKTYSGGMQRKLDIAIGLVHQPSVLFLDEPTTGLDPEARSDVWREISRLARDEGLTVLLTTHYMEEADRLSDRLAIIDHGRIVVEGTAEGLKSDLHGDSVQLSFAESVAQAQVMEIVGRMGGLLKQPSFDHRTLRGRVDSGAGAIPQMLAAFDAAGTTVETATVARPSLEDVYLRYTGHLFGVDGEYLP
jgi:ABC-2 type transport system ATP-binding protein